MVLVRLINKSDKVLFERCIQAPLEDIPFAKIFDVLNFLYQIPHDTQFIFQDLNNTDFKVKCKRFINGFIFSIVSFFRYGVWYEYWYEYFHRNEELDIQKAKELLDL